MDERPQTEPNSESSIQINGHILVSSFPLQGHAAPLVKLSNQIAQYGIRITFMTTEFSLSKMASSMPGSEEGNQIRLVSFPDGLDPDDDRKDQRKLSESIYRVMPGYLEDFLKKSNQSNNGDKITGVIFDSPLAFFFDIPRKMGIKCATYWCSTPGCLALGISIPKLVETEVIDTDGFALKNEKIQLLPNMPAMSPTEFTWYFPGDLNKQKSMFQFISSISHKMRSSDWIICNWFHELDPSACTLAPNLISVGPVLANGQSAGSFCSEDSSCLSWLDKQPPCSVIYVAFGSTSRFKQHQIDELAMGLELANRPFLWVAWSGLTGGVSPAFPDGFTDRVADRGKIVEWAPQEKVLAHPSITCFLSHCGWGSTMESISMGVPFLCWPYFGDQLYTQICICEAWKIGLWLNADENGIISRREIKQKIEKLLSETNIRSNALNMKEIAQKSISKGGSSVQNLEYLVMQMKQH